MANQTYTLQDVIQNGSCCRKGGDVELIETIAPGRVPTPAVVGLVYDSVKKAKAFSWSLQPFKGARLVLKYVGGKKDGVHFFLDGKFSSFLQSNMEITEASETYTAETQIRPGQVWHFSARDGSPMQILIRASARCQRVFISYGVKSEDEGSMWLPSDHPISVSAVRSSLASGDGQLAGSAVL